MRSIQPAAARGVNPSDLRRINEAVVLAAMGSGEQYRVNELMARTNLTRVTVTEVVRQLIDKGWIAPHSVSRGRGRPAQIYERVVPAGIVAGLEIGAYEVAVTVATMQGEICTRDRRAVTPHLSRAARLDRVIDLLHTAVAQTGSPLDDLWAVMVATTGTVSEAGVVKESVAIKDWAGTDLRAEIGERVGVPVEVRNDIQLFGRGEHRWGVAAGFSEALLVWLGRRPTVSLIVKGEPHVGAHGTAGDLSRIGRSENGGRIEQTRVQMPTLNLREAFAGDSELVDDPLRMLLRESGGGNTRAKTLIEEWFRELAPIISLSTAVVDPEIIVLGGPLIQVAENLVPILENDLDLHLQRRPIVALSTGGQDAVVDAAARYAIERVYARLQSNNGDGVAPLSKDALRSLG